MMMGYNDSKKKRLAPIESCGSGLSIAAKLVKKRGNIGSIHSQLLIPIFWFVIVAHDWAAHHHCSSFEALEYRLTSVSDCPASNLRNRTVWIDS